MRCQYGLINTLGLYINILEYTELLNRVIFDRAHLLSSRKVRKLWIDVDKLVQKV